MPEFLYAVDGVEVKEHLSNGEAGGLSWRFQIEKPPADVRIFAPQAEGVSIESTIGKREGDFWRVPREKAASFTLTIRNHEVLDDSALVDGSSACCCRPRRRASAYEVEALVFDKGVDAQVGGIDVLPDGRVFACFHAGDVSLYDPESAEWTLFARGLHEPLGLVAESASSVLVMQRPELTRIVDSDGDGVADEYRTVCDDFGMTGNYHEFAFGPVVDADGDFFVSLNVASNGAPVRDEVRGEWLDIGLPREDFAGDWGKVKGAAGRMYSRTPYRGWVVKIDRETGEMTPWSSGLRSPNGLGFDAEGRLFVSDNQGDWLGTSKLHHIEKGKFHGHPASLPWRENYDGRNPLEIPVEELEEMRTPAAIWFPHGSMANSPTEPVLIPDGFGPFGGQMLIGEMNRPRIIRLMLEEVTGVMQGACVVFLDGGGLAKGINRLSFGPDQTLWTGQTHLSWAGGEGIHRIRHRQGAEFQEVHTLSITRDGFRVKFLQPASDEDLAKATLRRYRYRYHKGYGSPESDKADVAVRVERIAPDEVQLLVDEPLKKDFLYEFQFPHARNPLVAYTVREIPE